MPFYYDREEAPTTNATAAVEQSDVRFLTVANQPVCRFTGFWLGDASGTAIRVGEVRLKTYATPGTGGTAVTPGKRHPSDPAAQTTLFNGAITAGTTPTTRIVVAWMRAIDHQAWLARDDDHAICLLPGGGAKGNAELVSIGVQASLPYRILYEFAEGDTDA